MALLEEHGIARRASELIELTCILCPGRGRDPRGRTALRNLCPSRGLDPRDRGPGCGPIAVSRESALMFIIE